MLADQAVEPTVEPACEIEIGAVDGEHEGVVQDSAVEPVRNDQLDASSLSCLKEFNVIILDKSVVSTKSFHFADRPTNSIKAFSFVGWSCRLG